MTDQVEKRTLKEKVIQGLLKASDFVEKHQLECAIAACAITGGIYSMYAYNKGYNDGFDSGTDCVTPFAKYEGYLEGVIDTVEAICNSEDS